MNRCTSWIHYQSWYIQSAHMLRAFLCFFVCLYNQLVVNSHTHINQVASLTGGRALDSDLWPYQTVSIYDTYGYRYKLL